MKKVILFLVIMGVLFSCSTKKEIVTPPTYQDDCTIMLDSLSTALQYIKFGVYKVDLDFFSIKKYEELSDLELARKGIPLQKKQQHIFEFEYFLKRCFKKGKCTSSLTSEMLIKKLGKSSDTSAKNIHTYIFSNIGGNCPNCNHSISRIFSECSYMRIYFDKKGYKEINISLRYN